MADNNVSQSRGVDLGASLNGVVSGISSKAQAAVGSLGAGLSGQLTNTIGGLGSSINGIGARLGKAITDAPTNMLNGFSNSLSQWAGNLRAGIIRDSIGSSTNKEFKVSLSDGLGNRLVFDSSPTIEESRQVQWDSYQITHLPANLVTFKSTGSRSLGITVKLVSRTSLEAADNYKRLQLIRYWSVPSFGIYGDGSPPNVLLLNGFTTHFKNIQVVLNSYSWSFPEEVDWIHTGHEPFPTVININISLQETFSPEQLVFFDKRDINGDLGGVMKWAQLMNSASASQPTSASMLASALAQKNVNPNLAQTVPGLAAAAGVTTPSALSGLATAEQVAAGAKPGPLANLGGAVDSLAKTGSPMTSTSLGSVQGTIDSVNATASNSFASVSTMTSNVVNSSFNQAKNNSGTQSMTNLVQNTQQANNTGLRG